MGAKVKKAYHPPATPCDRFYMPLIPYGVQELGLSRLVHANASLTNGRSA